MQKSKRKHISGKRKYQIIAIGISVLMILLMRFPIHFLGDLFRYTGLVYIATMFIIIIYTMRIMERNYAKGLAIIVLIVTIFSTLANAIEISRSSHAYCRHTSNLYVECEWIAGSDSKYLTFPLIPVGIQVKKHLGSFIYHPLF